MRVFNAHEKESNHQAQPLIRNPLVLCPSEQVPALRAGVVSSLRPRQGGMVIGVVPRYDPHGMGLPIPRFAGEPALRQRAATLSLDSQREVKDMYLLPGSCSQEGMRGRMESSSESSHCVTAFRGDCSLLGWVERFRCPTVEVARVYDNARQCTVHSVALI